MTQAVEPNQYSIATFPNRQLAEQALRALQDAGFTSDRVSLVTQTPPVKATEAKKSGIRGAIAGALGGGLAGLILSLTKIDLVGGIPAVDPVRNSMGLFLAGSFVGAIGMGIIGAMTGVNVREEKSGTEAGALLPIFVLFARDLQPDELNRAKAISQRYTTENFEY